MNRVIIVIYHLGVGGAERLIVDEIKELLRRGVEVHLVTLSEERNNSLIGEVPPECKRTLVRFKGLFDWRAVITLARIFKDMKPHLIMSHLWFANTVVRVAARMAGKEQCVIVFEHNVYDRVKTWKQFLADRLLQRWCRKIVAVSGSVRESLLSHGIRASQIAVMYNAIDLERYAHASAASIRAELKLEDQFIYLFVGRLVEQKGVDILLDAFAQLDSGVLILAGQGEDRQKLEAQAQALGIKRRVFFLGVRRDVPSLLKAADCLVLPSRWEGFGMVLIEAMAAGVPIVATAIDGIKEVIVNGETGVLVPREDASALAGALRQIAHEPALRRHLVERGVRHAREQFSIQTHVNDLLALI